MDIKEQFETLVAEYNQLAESIQQQQARQLEIKGAVDMLNKLNDSLVKAEAETTEEESDDN